LPRGRWPTTDWVCLRRPHSRNWIGSKDYFSCFRRP
jgi:hypothetical protein